MKIVKDMLLLG